MRYAKHLYLSDGLEKKVNKIIRKIEAGKFQINVFLLTLPQSSDRQLEIINSSLLLQPSYPKEDYFVVGITKSYEEAIEMVEKISQEVYDKTKAMHIRDYILKQEQEY